MKVGRFSQAFIEGDANGGGEVQAADIFTDGNIISLVGGEFFLNFNRQSLGFGAENEELPRRDFGKLPYRISPGFC